MNISNWSINQIMQLPDHLFGIREERIFSYDGLGGGDVFLFSEEPLPNICVIWELYANFHPRDITGVRSGVDIGIRLGGKYPGGTPEFNLMEEVFKGVTTTTSDRGTFQGRIHLTNLRKVISPQGRRFVVYLDDLDSENQSIVIGMVISSIPTEVPDWMLKG